MMLKKKIENLISLIENTEIEEIEVSSFWGAQKIRLSKSSKKEQNIVLPDVNRQNNKIDTIKEIEPKTSNESVEIVEDNIGVDKENNQEIESEEDFQDETKYKIVRAPLVGTFYSSPRPEDPPFVNIGDSIKTGDIVCIIEAMKIFNDIDSEFNGELIHIYVKDGTPVEYGQELFVLKI